MVGTNVSGGGQTWRRNRWCCGRTTRREFQAASFAADSAGSVGMISVGRSSSVLFADYPARRPVQLQQLVANAHIPLQSLCP
jgi:hypothetical protein